MLIHSEMKDLLHEVKSSCTSSSMKLQLAAPPKEPLTVLANCNAL